MVGTCTMKDLTVLVDILEQDKLQGRSHVLEFMVQLYKPRHMIVVKSIAVKG